MFFYNCVAHAELADVGLPRHNLYYYIPFCLVKGKDRVGFMLYSDLAIVCGNTDCTYSDIL